MNLLSKIWLRMFRSQSTEDEAMPEQDLAPVVPTPSALGIPAATVAAAVADIAAAKADLAVNEAARSAAAVAEATPVSPVAEGAVAVDPQVNTDTLRDLLKALGHDIGDVWSDVVRLAKKAI